MNLTFYKLQQVLLFLLLNISLIAQSSMELTDKVSLLKLDKELPSRSQLGGVCVDRLGFIYVSNFLDAVWKISPQGKVTLLTDGLYGSSGNTIDAKGNLYQANFLSHSIVKIDRFGKVTTFIEEGLNGPVGMAFDSKNNLYLCNFHENNILKITPEKQISVFAKGGMFNGPNGITIDNDDNLYVVNFQSNQVIKITAAGSISTFADVKGVDGNAHIVFYNDNFYVTKIKSNQLFQINTAGKVKPLAGTGKTEITEGNALEASFSAPNGIGVDTQTGELYLNNVNGEWTSRKASTIDISKITLLTISQVLTHHLDNNDIDAAKKAFWDYHKDPFHAHENIGPPTGTLGWRYMTKRNVTAAITLFELVNEAYPERWRPYYYLGDVYKFIGQPEQAKSYYKQALEKDPGNAAVMGKLKDLK